MSPSDYFSDESSSEDEITDINLILKLMGVPVEPPNLDENGNNKLELRGPSWFRKTDADLIKNFNQNVIFRYFYQFHCFYKKFKYF